MNNNQRKNLSDVFSKIDNFNFRGKTLDEIKKSLKETMSFVGEEEINELAQKIYENQKKVED